MNRKHLFIFLPFLFICFTFIACSKSTKNNESSEEISDISLSTNENENSKEKAVKSIKPNDLNGKSVSFEGIDFKQKNTADIISFFENYNIKFKKNNTILSNFTLDNNNEYIDVNKYDKAKFPDSPSVGWYIYNKRMNMITTTSENDKTNLILKSLDLDNLAKDTILLEDVLYRQPYYYYDDTNKLYYSTIKKDGSSSLGLVNLKNLQTDELITYKTLLKDDKYTGDIITLVSQIDNQIIYQLSTYKDQKLSDTKPINNKLVFLDDPDKFIDIGDNNYDVVKDMEAYIITHDTGYEENQYLIKIYDKEFNLLYKLDNDNIDRVVGLTLLNKNGNDYLLIMDGLQTFYLVDLTNNKDNYLLTNIITEDRLVENSHNKIIVTTKYETYIGSK